MPNGGVPIHMAVYPKDGSPVVLYCKGGQLFLYEREAWDREGTNGKPLCTFTAEARAPQWLGF